MVAVSGGFDSTALLLGLNEMSSPNLNLVAAHFNHRLRGEESDDDEAFVKSMCEELDVQLSVGRAEARGVSTSEDEARAKRYAFLGSVAKSADAQNVALAHTLEDQAETVLLRLTRGTGVRGMGAMRRSTQIKLGDASLVTIFRPMLDITHAEARSYLDSRGIKARHDASNDEWERYSRNRIRHRVIPELQQINPEATVSLSRFSQIMQSQSELLDALTDEAFGAVDMSDLLTFDRAKLTELHPAIVAEILTRMHKRNTSPRHQLTDAHIRMMLKIASAPGTGSYHLPGGVTFEAQNNIVRITDDLLAPPKNDPYPTFFEDALLEIPGSTPLGEEFELVAYYETAPDQFDEDSRFDAWLSPALIPARQLEVRNRRPGDTIQPLGMAEDVRLQRFFINSKVPKQLRDRVPIVVSQKTGKIVWVAGVRQAEWAKLLPEHDVCLHLSLRKK